MNKDFLKIINMSLSIQLIISFMSKSKWTILMDVIVYVWPKYTCILAFQPLRLLAYSPSNLLSLPHMTSNFLHTTLHYTFSSHPRPELLIKPYKCHWHGDWRSSYVNQSPIVLSDLIVSPVTCLCWLVPSVDCFCVWTLWSVCWVITDSSGQSVINHVNHGQKLGCFVL